MKDYFHYTYQRHVENIKRTGVYDQDSNFTTDAYFDPTIAGQALGINPSEINCVLKFKDDGLFRNRGFVQSSNRFTGGGTQYAHPSRPKPIAIRRIDQQFWRNL